ncbi:nucleotidyltransferase [Desulfurococcaceae archaeon MEX13E-LK6-19]|nr:nucleotidyltransferase [Desulfurococcaceae archaeon MEX13E-LK6-19]
MGYSIDELAYVLGKLMEYGIDFVIIGDTVVQFALKKKILEGDVDLFVISPSVIVEEEKYGSIAESEGWLYATTDAGTPKIIARVDDKEIPLEFYENIFDIYVPEEIISGAGKKKISGIEIKMIKPEEYIVLKARQGVDLDKLSKYISELKNDIDKRIILRTIMYFPEDEEKLIISRLRQAGLSI